MRNRVLQRIGVIALIITVLLSGILLVHKQQPQATTGPYDGNIMRVELYVYKNRELVYYDPDDPAVNNIAYLIGELLDYDGVYNAPSGQRMDGSATWSSGLVCGAEGKPIIYDGKSTGVVDTTRGFVVVGRDDLFSRQDYTLANVLDMAFIDEYIINSSSSEITLTLGGSITYPSNATSNYTVTAVGLGLTACDPGYDISVGASWLLFKDVLSTPVTLAPGDTIHVRYVIHLP